MEELEYYFRVKDNDKIEMSVPLWGRNTYLLKGKKKTFSFIRKEFWTTSLTGGILGCGKNGKILLWTTMNTNSSSY